MIDEKLFNELLLSREERSYKQQEIIERYPYTLISFTLNIPGIIKDKPLYRRVHKTGVEEILKAIRDKGYKIEYREERNKVTGSEAFISIHEESEKIKRITVEIEDNHPLGRLFDIDVFDKNYEQMSRRDFGHGSRKCLVCENDAKECAVGRRHSYEELIERVESMALNYYENNR